MDDRGDCHVLPMPSRPAAVRRAIVLVHFDAHGAFDPYVLHAVAAYRRHADRLVLVSNGGGRLHPALVPLVDTYLSRPNIGYDFAGWRAGLATLQRADYDEVVCANDSVYGPLFDLAPALSAARTATADLWGMVVSDQPAARRAARAPHVQTWFFGMRRRLLESACLDAFWRSVEPVPSKREVIERYEIGLSRSVVEAGFEIAGLYDSTTAPRVGLGELVPHVSLAAPVRSWRLVRKSRRTPHNPSELVWWRLLEAGVPFVKVSLFRANHYGLDLNRVVAGLKRSTPYDLGLIHRHLARCG
jgi:lipopolysaccharide biosynthesis protein